MWSISNLISLFFEAMQEKPYTKTMFSAVLTAKGRKNFVSFEVTYGLEGKKNECVILKGGESVHLSKNQFYSVKNLKDKDSILVIKTASN